MSLVTMNKVIIVLPCFFLSALAGEPFYRHIISSPHASSEVFYTGSERQVLASAPLPAVAPAPLTFPAPAAPLGVVAAAPLPFPAPAAPLAVAAPAAPLAFPAPAASLAVAAPAAPVAVSAAPLALPAAPAVAAAPVPVAPVAPVVAPVKLSYPQYAFGYSVQDFTTGDNKVAKEVREGGIVKGSYSVADPDGTKRTVNYYADPIHGFNAVVHKTKIL